jgi:ribosome-associated protein
VSDGAPAEPFIRLDQLLKREGVAGTGGQAKWLIQQGLVRVNGAVEERRGRKLREDDVVAVEGREIRVRLSE